MIISVSFFIMRLAPGGPFDQDRALPKQVRANIEARYHLDEPLWTQYFRYLGDVTRGDLGPSFRYPDRSVNELLGLGWLPVAGWGTWRHMILPSLALGAFYAAYVARLTRAGMPEVIGQDFIRTARAKGLREAAVVLRHALPSAILPVVTYLGPASAAVLTGSVVIETIFSIPGIGRYFVGAALNHDYTLVLGTVVSYSVVLLSLNLAVDVLYAWLDPRVQIR